MQPSSGTAAKRRHVAANKIAPTSKTIAKPKATKSIIDMLQRTHEEIVDERCSVHFQPTIQSSRKTNEEKHYVDMQWALFFYECDIPFNAAATR